MIPRIILAAAVLMLWAGSARADVAALSYTDTASQVQTVAPSKQYINPVGGIDLYLTAGLDRKVRYVIKDASGASVAEGVSGLITGADTFTVLGQTYYGKVLSVPAALSEGSYTLTAQILTSGGSMVSAQNYALVVDRTPPAAGELWWLARPALDPPKSIMANEVVGGSDVRQIWVKSVSDANGIASVRFETYDPAGGTVHTTQTGWYTAASQEAGIGSSSGVPAGSLPAFDGPMGVRFILIDRAGNATVAAAVVRYDGTCDPLPQLVAVYNPGVTTEYLPGSGLVGYQEYVPGMAVQANPMKLLYRLPRSNWANDNPDYGLTAFGGTVAYTDAQHVYLRFEVPYDATRTLNQNTWRFTNPRWYSAGQLSYNLALAAGVPQSPALVAWQVYRTDTGWTAPVPGSTGEAIKVCTNGSGQVNKLRAQVEARPYEQQVTFTVAGNISPCTVPAGATECTADITFSPPASGYAYISKFVQVKSADGTLYTTTTPNLLVLYDLAGPSIVSHDLDQSARTLSFVVNKPNNGAVSNNIHLKNGWLLATETSTLNQITIPGVKTGLGGDLYRINVNIAALPEGNWSLQVQARDEAENVATQNIGSLALDTAAPSVQIFRSGMVLSNHDAIDSLGKISFTVTDNVDPNPVVQSVRLIGGPESTDVYLAYHVKNGAYILEYRVLYPSGGSEYALTVTARDASGNIQTKTLPFSYNPPEVKLASSSTDRLNLPVLPANVVRKDGSNALLSQPILVDGAPVSGAYDLVVLSSASSTAPVVVNNVAIAPGEQKTVPGFDFALTGGRLNLPIRAEAAGQATILVTSGAPEFPVLTAVVQAWQPQVQLTADPGWSVQPLVQTHKIGAAPGAGTPCKLTYNAAEAQAADPIDDPVCLVEFTTKPSGYQLKDGLLQGYLTPDGPFAVGYQVSVYNNGAKYILGTGSQDLVLLPLTDVAVSLAAPAPPVYQRVQEISLAAQSAGRIPCRVTADQAEAVRLGAYEPTCLVRWQAVPAGLSAADGLSVLRGRLDTPGAQTVAWSVDVYAPAGLAKGASTGSLELTALEPPEPTFSLQPGLYAQAVDDANLVVMSEGGGDVGSVQFRPPIDNAGLTLTVEVDGAAESYVFQPVRAITFSRYLRLGSLPVWTTRDLRVTLSYTNLPEKRLEKSYRVTVAPPKRLEAWLTADRVGSSTTGLGVGLQVGSRTMKGIHYNRAEHGNWEVEFGYIEGVDGYRAMTAKELVPESGVLAKTLNPPLGNVKLVAVLSLKPPAAASFYSRTLLSNKAYAQVLKGDAPAGEISSTVASGPAPLVALPKLKVDTENQRVLGRITWQLSRDNGATWEGMSGMQPYMAQLKLDPGQYLVRVELENKFSGAKGYTNQLAFTAYDVPEVAVSGPNAVIVDTPMTLQAALANKGATVEPDNAVIQWYRHSREGDTLVQTGPSYTVTPSELGNYQYIVKASLKSAVATDAKAWRQAVKFVRVVPPAPPEIRLIAPNSMEYNTKEAQTYRLQALVSLRYGLDQVAFPVEGEWELPDGAIVSGAEVRYSPSATDAAQRKSVVVYRAWIKGMKESTTAAVVKSIPLTIYDWPTFSIKVDQDYAMAPTLVTLTAMPSTGKPWTLEKPQYTWSLPEGAALVRSLDNGRMVQAVINQAGRHTVSVDIQDARGSTATATAAVELAAAPPFTVSFQPLYSNPDLREPLDVLVRARFSGGHPADRIVSVAYATEAPGATVNQSLGYVQGLPAGDQTITVTATTKFGQTVTAALPVSVALNQRPSCTLSSRRDARYVYLEAACSDPDGKIAAYRWYRNGRVVGCSNRLTQSLADAAQAVSFEAIDNNGAKYQETITPNTGG